MGRDLSPLGTAGRWGGSVTPSLAAPPRALESVLDVARTGAKRHDFALAPVGLAHLEQIENELI